MAKKVEMIDDAVADLRSEHMKAEQEHAEAFAALPLITQVVMHLEGVVAEVEHHSKHSAFPSAVVAHLHDALTVARQAEEAVGAPNGTQARKAE